VLGFGEWRPDSCAGCGDPRGPRQGRGRPVRGGHRQAFGRAAGRSLEEVRRTLESGKAAFLNLDPKGGGRRCGTCCHEIDRLPLGPARWELFWETRAWLARVLQHGAEGQGDRAVLQILRVDEDFQLAEWTSRRRREELLELTRSLAPSFPRASSASARARARGRSTSTASRWARSVPKSLMAGE
jgi:hypothetical protein